MTLPELLVSVALLGLVMVVISAAVVVVLRNEQAAAGRLNIARGEQSLDVWMPADLASVNVDTKLVLGPDDPPDPYGLTSGYDSVIIDAGANPCGAGVDLTCPPGVDLSGSNKLLLRWRTLVSPGPTVLETNVSYRYVNDGGEYQLVRLKCEGAVGTQGVCSSIVVLHDLASDWDMEASDPDLTGDGVDYENVAGQQVTVTISGGVEGAEGAGGGTDTVSLTAGGVAMGTISATEPTGAPSFIRESSRCGGPITILVDDSNSIGTGDMGTVRAAVRSFLEEFRGTPMQVQVIRFGTTAYVLGNGTTGNGYYDMSENSEVDAIKAQITESNLSGNSGSAGGTNWEDAWYRALVDNERAGDQIDPDTIVFFTDGVPTFYRNNDGSHGGPGNAFSKSAWRQARDVAAPFRRATPPSIIGVGVNGASDGLNRSWTWNNSGATRAGKQILARLIDNTFSGVPFTGDNEEQANLYLLDGFSGLTAALKTIALKDCGGTLTVRTRLDSGGDGQKFGPEVVYENEVGSGDDAVTRTVATSQNFPTGTFDFEILSGSLETTVVPQVSSSLSDYELSRWECRAGPTSLTATLVDIGGDDFDGVQVSVPANGASSCTMWVQAK